MPTSNELTCKSPRVRTGGSDQGDCRRRVAETAPGDLVRGGGREEDHGHDSAYGAFRANALVVVAGFQSLEEGRQSALEGGAKLV